MIFVANILIQHRICWTLECGSFFKGREIPICVIRMSDFYLNHSFEICVRIRFQSSSEWVEGSLKLSLCRFMCNIRSLSWIDLSDGSFAHHWDMRQSWKKRRNTKWTKDVFIETMLKHVWVTIAESFYYVNYGSSMIMSKSLSKNLSNQNKHLWWYYKNSSFWHFLIQVFLKTSPKL